MEISKLLDFFVSGATKIASIKYGLAAFLIVLAAAAVIEQYGAEPGALIVAVIIAFAFIFLVVILERTIKLPSRSTNIAAALVIYAVTIIFLGSLTALAGRAFLSFPRCLPLIEECGSDQGEINLELGLLNARITKIDADSTTERLQTLLGKPDRIFDVDQASYPELAAIRLKFLAYENEHVDVIAAAIDDAVLAVGIYSPDQISAEIPLLEGLGSIAPSGEEINFSDLRSWSLGVIVSYCAWMGRNTFEMIEGASASLRSICSFGSRRSVYFGSIAHDIYEDCEIVFGFYDVDENVAHCIEEGPRGTFMPIFALAFSPETNVFLEQNYADFISATDDLFLRLIKGV